MREPTRWRGPVRSTLLAGAILAGLAMPRPAWALQPLGDFLSAARKNASVNRELTEVLAQRDGEADQAWGRILPALTARGQYTRNQYETVFKSPEIVPDPATGFLRFSGNTRDVTLVPQDQLDAFFTLDVPLIDVASWHRLSAARAAVDATEARTQATALDIDQVVVARYYGILAAEALIASTERSKAAAEQNKNIVLARQAAGAATELEVERAQAEIERARQSIADAELLRETSRRALETLAGITPDPGATALDESLADEAPLNVWMGTDVAALPAVRAAALERRAADRASGAAKSALVPTIAATATERITNASGFSGNNASWTAGLVATLRLDYAVVGAIKAQGAAARGAAVREDRARREAGDKIHTAWHQVRSALAKSKAARSQLKALQHAVQLARERFQTGAGTQLDLILADRDALTAEVARIMADAELANARVALRLAGGKPIDGRPTEPGPAAGGPAAPASTPGPAAPAVSDTTPQPGPQAPGAKR